MNKKIILALALILLVQINSAARCTGVATGNDITPVSGQCCDYWNTVPDTDVAALALGTGVKTCSDTAKSTDTTQVGDLAAATCIAGYGLASGGICTQCLAGTYALEGASTPCTNCPAGTYSTTVGATSADTCLPCPQGKGSAAGANASTLCTDCTNSAIAGAKNCDTTNATTQGQATSCIDGYVYNANTCVKCDVANCKTCAQATATTVCGGCMSGFSYTAKTGTMTTDTCTACTLAGCDTCAVAATCTKCKQGFLKAPATGAITGCTDCTTIEGCLSCTGEVSVCTKAKAGWYIKSGTPNTVQQCPAGKSSADGATGANDTEGCALACDGGPLCLDCRADITKCVDCGADAYYDDAATPQKLCVAHTPSTRHVSCATSWGLDSKLKDDRCVTCKTTNKVLTPAIAASGTTPASTYGQCNTCAAGYKVTNATDATQDSTCTACGLNVKNCDNPANLTCSLPTQFQTGTTCTAQPTDPSGVAGYFFNNVTNAFQACHSSCATCTAANQQTACKSCPAALTNATAPAEDDPTYDRWLKVPVLNETSCWVMCPVDYVANEGQNGCVADASSSFLSVIVLIIMALLF